MGEKVYMRKYFLVLWLYAYAALQLKPADEIGSILLTNLVDFASKPRILNMHSTQVFILPGLNNSGPQHWQTLWELEHGFTRVQQKDWDTPVCEDWINTIDEAIKTYPPDQVVLIGHSLACCTIAHWAGRYKRTIKAALLVGPSDVEAPSYPAGTSGFTPMPLQRLPFRSIVVASSDDQYVTMERAVYFANCWGSQLIDIGALGHINSASNIGSWPEGYKILQSLINMV